MAFVLPQAPPKMAAVAPKVPAATVPPKSPHGPELGVPASLRGRFQALLDQAAHSKGPQDPAASDKPKTAKAKGLDHGTEKPRETRRSDPKDHKDPKAEGAEALVLAGLNPPARAEAAPAKTLKASEAEAPPAASDRSKTGGRSDRRTGAEVPAPVTAAAAEVARAQAQQSSGRADRSEEKPKVFVVDRRSDKEREKLKTPGSETPSQQNVNAAVEVQTQAKPVDSKAAAAEVQVSFQTAAGKGREGFDLKPQAAQPSPRDAATFQQYLVDRGYGQLVDSARIVLRDQNAGEIRMTLYPESLGKVKVSLDLSDNTLAGQIYVENQTVKEVFQSNMDGLLQAFQDGGWDDVSLQVSVGGEGGAGTPNQQSQPGPQARDYGRQVAQTVTVDGRTDRIGSWNDRQINLTA